jgi:hypothetical protein
LWWNFVYKGFYPKAPFKRVWQRKRRLSKRKLLRKSPIAACVRVEAARNGKNAANVANYRAKLFLKRKPWKRKFYCAV